MNRVEQWGCFEAALKSARTYANPFTDADLSARFECDGEAVTVKGFHDGDGIWKIRCMPTKEGRWTFRTQSSDPELDGKTGEFLCGPPAKGNHGPVRVAGTWHFAYADGTPYFQIGTTCYAWIHQTEALQEQTLKTLAASPFSKIRFCVFPKSYTYNQNDPPFYPFERKANGKFDFTRPNPVSWRHLERRILDLQRLGIEADLILWHPYDRWGFAEMGKEHDDRYLRTCIARLAAFRNVWWSLANEYDLMAPNTKNHRGDKLMADWDRFFQILHTEDPFGRLRSIHNCRGFYDHTRPWVSHASIQSSDLASGPAWREKYRKPIVYDECKYEGNVPQGWGNLTAEQMADRFWLGTVGGCYVGHGETYMHPKDILWWSKGGVLHGQSPARIAFLKRIMEPVPFHQMAPDAAFCPGNATLAKPGELYFVYCLKSGPATIGLPGDRPYKVDGIDTWNMTVAPLGTARPGRFTFTPPKAPYLVRFEAGKPAEGVVDNGTLKTVLEVSLGSRIGQCRAVPVQLGQGSRPAFLAIYCADATVDPWSEMFFYATDTLKLALLDADGKILWRLDLGKGVVPGMWFCPFFAFDLDGDGTDEIYFVNNIDADHPLGHRGRRLERLDARTGKSTGRWPWPAKNSEQSMSHAYRNFILGGHARDEAVLVTAQGTYESMHLQAWTRDMKPRWERTIAANAPGARGSHMCPIADLDGDGVQEVMWGERCIELDTGKELFCADRDAYRGHSDVVMPFTDPKTGQWLLYTCRESDPKAKPRVVVFDARGNRVWGAVDEGHMDMGWVARLGEGGAPVAMAIRIGSKGAGPGGTTRTGVHEFVYNAVTGEKLDLGFSVYRTLPVDLDGDGLHELVRTTDGDGLEVIDRRGKRLGDLGAGGHVAMACKLLDLPGEQVLVAYPDGTLRVWADPKAKDSEAALARYRHPLYQANRRLFGTGYNLNVLGGP